MPVLQQKLRTLGESCLQNHWCMYTAYHVSTDSLNFVAVPAAALAQWGLVLAPSLAHLGSGAHTSASSDTHQCLYKHRYT